MTASYTSHAAFDAARETLLQAVDPRRRRVLRILVHERLACAPPLAPLAEAARYLAFLGASIADIAGFEPVTRAEARRICADVAHLDLVMAAPHMPRPTAEAIADRWLDAFDASAALLVSGARGRSRPPGLGVGPSLYHQDLEAGVVAFDARRAGILWSASDS